MLSCFARSVRAVNMKNQNKQQGSNRAILVPCTYQHYRVCQGVQIQELLLGTESFDPGWYRLMNLNTQDCKTIGIASLIVAPRDRTKKKSVRSLHQPLTAAYKACSLTPVANTKLRFVKIRSNTSPLNSFVPYRPLRFLSPSRFSTRDLSLVVVTTTVVCENDASSPLLLSWQHLWLPTNPSPSSDRTFAQSPRPSPSHPTQNCHRARVP